MRVLLSAGLALAFLSGCAAPRATATALDSEGYEAREEVLRAEREREAMAWEERLVRLRRAQDVRQGSHSTSSTRAVDRETTGVGGAVFDVRGSEGDSVSEEDSVVESGSSVRALKVRPTSTSAR